MKTVRANLAIARQAGKDRYLEVIDNLVAAEKALDEQIKSLGYLIIDIGKFKQHRSQLNTSFDSIPDDVVSGFQLTPTSSRVSAHSTSNNQPSEILQIKTDEIGNLVESFLEDFKLELSELSTRYNKTEQIKKEALHVSILDQKPTTGFWQDVRNKFYEFVYAKAESEDSEAYKTVIQTEQEEQVAPTNIKIENNLKINNTLIVPMAVNHNRGPSFKDILRLVPNFSGRDKNEAISFVKGCRHAKKLVDVAQQGEFIKLLPMKLSGIALETIDTSNNNKIDLLTNFIEGNFGTNKLFYELYGELSKLKQGNKEGVLAFYARLKDLGRDITAAARHDEKDAPPFEENLNNDLLITFKRGFHWELKVRLNNANTLEEARSEAIK
uniref:Uncharacterized protein n=1 Tax=Trichogramma kaykai TaxID=54128 RepID=A0ABD2WPC1_9HYME